MNPKADALDNILFSGLHRESDIEAIERRNRVAIELVALDRGGEGLLGEMREFSKVAADDYPDPFSRVFAITTHLEELHPGSLIQVSQKMEEARTQEQQAKMIRRVFRSIFGRRKP